MLKIVCLLVCFQTPCPCKTFDFKFITAVRHGIVQNLEYIHQNYEQMNEDCWLGVALATAIIKDVYQNGTNVMDRSSLRLLRMSLNVLRKGVSSIDFSKFWIAKYVLDPRVWQKEIKYKNNVLSGMKHVPDARILEKIYKYQNLSDEYPNSDVCLQNIINLTSTFSPKKCNINKDCWEKYFEDDRKASGYILTHKLLLIQLAKARKCYISDQEYERRVRKLCSKILTEVISVDFFEVFDYLFDLFLEEVLLCGFEGYNEFFKTKWLASILKSQRQSGCFPAFLGDPFKTRIRRTTNTFADGCADHTTGLGAAVLSLYYNFIIKNNKQTFNYFV